MLVSLRIASIAALISLASPATAQTRPAAEPKHAVSILEARGHRETGDTVIITGRATASTGALQSTVDRKSVV